MSPRFSYPFSVESRVRITLVFLLVLCATVRTVSAQGTRLAFVYASDLWIVGRDGGDARRLTSFQGVEEWPRFSPDGKWVAFTGEYGGNRDVYVIAAEGGEPKRLTWHPGDDEVQGWTPDGKRVVFASGRTGAPIPFSTFWSVAVEGGMPEQLPIPRAWKGTLSPDGRSAAYMTYALVDLEWRNYRGGQAQPIWIQSLQDASLEKLPSDGSRQMDPVWLDSGIYFRLWAGEWMAQIGDSFRPLLSRDPPYLLFSNIIFVGTMLAVMLYFLFSFEHRSRALRNTATTGRWLMMIAFGAMFGSTVMARMSLFIGRLTYLFQDWIHLIPRT